VLEGETNTATTEDIEQTSGGARPQRCHVRLAKEGSALVEATM